MADKNTNQKPRSNTLPQDIETYQAERTKFTEYLGHFKNGNVNYALPSLNSLEIMYMELVYSFHHSLSHEKAEEFLEKIEELRTTMRDYVCKQHAGAFNERGQPKLKHFLKQEEYLEMLSDFSDLYQKFKRYKNEVGLG